MESLYDPKALDDLEIVIRANDANGYVAYIRMPDQEIAYTTLSKLPILENLSDPLTYGEQLYQWLLPPKSEVEKLFTYARDLLEVSTRGFEYAVRLRLRISLDPTSTKLHRLLWESLYTPDGFWPFSLTTAFSRFMHIDGPRNLPIRKRPLRMLLIISNPQGVDRFSLHEFDPELEKSIIEDATSSIRPILHLDSLKGPQTLAQIRAKVQDTQEDGEGYHIVHLLAPSALHDDHGFLLLPDKSGQAQEVSIKAIVSAIAPSSCPPRLVFLAAPLTAHRQGNRTLISLAQKLIEAGVQALVAVQSPISATNLLRFMKRFYATLMHTGVIDVAIAEARTEIYNPKNWEWTHPVLYMRTSDGRLFQPLSETLEREITGITIKDTSQ